MIGRNGERRSGISAQAARHDDDDDPFLMGYLMLKFNPFINVYNFPSYFNYTIIYR